jgi:flavin-dependent dehydrogenase
MEHKEVIIVGGGLAGLTAAIHLSKAGQKVTLFEKNEFPKHKVCGEYVSNEVLPYFNVLGVDLALLNPVKITKTSISTISGKQVSAKLPLGGFGISRYALDHRLYEDALANGCEIIAETVTDIVFEDDHFAVSSGDSIYTADVVIGAFGKRSNIDQKLSRNFIVRKSPWLAVKAHYKGDFPDDLVELHNFRGGYCGVSKVENDTINICYLANFESFKKYKNIEEYQEKVLSQNPKLKAIFNQTMAVFKPITISQISFEDKLPVENHILMIGDTAGLIHPLCGNGMAMAIHSAKIASELVLEYFAGEIPSRADLEKRYSMAWNSNFRTRMQTGRLIASLMRKEKLSNLLMKMLALFPFLLPAIIRRTHGNSLNVI